MKFTESWSFSESPPPASEARHGAKPSESEALA